MKNLFLKKFHKLFLLITFSPMLLDVNVLLARENTIHSLPIKKEFNEVEKYTNNLIPMPAGDIDSSSIKVNFDRNPFQEPLKTEYPTIENLYSSLRFKGLAQSDKKLVAIIETDKGQKFYKVLAESALRAVRLCQPLKVPPTGYDKWKDLQLNFNPAEMLEG